MALENPNAPRSWTFQLVQPPEPPVLPDAMWRCGKHLVYYVAGGGQMPQTCLWTGAETGTELRDVELCLELPNAWRWRFPPLRFGYQRAFRTIVVRLPVSTRKLQQLQEKKAQFGRLILTTAAICGVPLLGLLPFVYPFEDGRAVPASLPFVLVLIGSAMCVGLAVVGAFWTNFRGTPGPGTIRAKLTEETYVWLAGVHSQVLNELPDWPGRKLDQFDFRFSYPIVFVNFLINVAIGFLVAAFVLLIRIVLLILPP